MTFIYSTDIEVLDRMVNGKDGVEVQIDPTEDGFGTDDYLGDDLLFENEDLAWQWARELLKKLAERSNKRVRVDVLP